MAHLASYEFAFREQSHAPVTADLTRDPACPQKLYRFDAPRTEKIGARCLLPGRIVKRGVRFLRCTLAVDTLTRNGMLISRLVIWTSEFGCTPTGKDGKSLDHSRRSFMTSLAVGEIKREQVHRQTDEFGYAAVENKALVVDLQSTIRQLPGSDHEYEPISLVEGSND